MTGLDHIIILFGLCMSVVLAIMAYESASFYDEHTEHKYSLWFSFLCLVLYIASVSATVWYIAYIQTRVMW